MRTRYFTAALFIIAAIAFGDDLKTIDGKEYKNVTVDRVEPDGLIISHSVGRAKIPLTKLPKYVQKKYYPDRVAAGAADRAAAQAADEKRRAEQKALDDKRVKEEKDAKKKRQAEQNDDKRVEEERAAEEKRRALAIILGALAVTAVVYLLVRGRPKAELVPFKDDGEQQIISPVPLTFDLEISPVLDPGDQKLEKVGPLVAAGGS